MSKFWLFSQQMKGVQIKDFLHGLSKYCLFPGSAYFRNRSAKCFSTDHRSLTSFRHFPYIFSKYRRIKQKNCSPVEIGELTFDNKFHYTGYTSGPHPQLLSKTIVHLLCCRHFLCVCRPLKPYAIKPPKESSRSKLSKCLRLCLHSWVIKKQMPEKNYLVQDGPQNGDVA